MSNLPNPIDLTQQPIVKPEHHYSKEKNSFDLNKWHKNFKAAYKKAEHTAITQIELPQDFINPTALLYDLIDRDLWRLRGLEVIGKYIGFSSRYKSLAISLFDSEDVKAICIRSAWDSDGNPIKWKTYGSKRFIPYRIFDKDDPAIFVGYGIGEFLLFELLEFNYIVLQSDSIAKSLSSNPYTPQIEDRYIFALLDNDASCKATLEPLKSHFSKCKVIGIDFENFSDKELPKGYDFRDFCNEIAKEVRGNSYLADPQEVKEAITNTLANYIQKLIKE